MSIDWVKAIKEVGESDLNEVAARIEELERELDALRTLVRVFRARTGATSTGGRGKKREPKSEGDSAAKAKPFGGKVRDCRERAAAYLLHGGVPVRPAILVRDLEIPEGSRTHVFEHPWFERRPEGIVLTREGRAAAGGGTVR